MERLDTKLDWPRSSCTIWAEERPWVAQQGFREEGGKETGRVRGRGVQGVGQEEPLDRQGQQGGPGDPVTGPWWGRWSCPSDPMEVPA